MPVARMNMAEGPDDSLDGQPVLHLRIGRDIVRIVVIYETAVEHPRVNQKCHEDQSQTNPHGAMRRFVRRHPVIQETIDEVHTRFLPEKIMVFADGADEQEFLKGFVPFFGTITSAGGKQTAYLCELSCDLPVSDVETMIHILENKNRKPRTEHSL